LEKENRPQSMSDWLQQLELPPPPVEEKYRQEKVNPPQPRKEPKVAETKAPVNPKPSENSLQKKLQALPWDWLIGVFLVYGLFGYGLAASSARWQVVAWAVAVAWAGALAWAVAGAGAWAWAVALALAWAGALALLWASALAGYWSEGVVVAWVVAGVVAGAVARAVFWLSEKTSIFDPWKDTAWFHTLLFFVFPGLIVFITNSLILSYDFVGGIVFGIISIVILFIQVYTTINLDKKTFSHFNIFLILAVTNLSGLASGWLLGLLQHSKG
jgi:serine/threonine-protein kinase